MQRNNLLDDKGLQGSRAWQTLPRLWHSAVATRFEKRLCANHSPPCRRPDEQRDKAAYEVAVFGKNAGGMARGGGALRRN
jgi:hypothetical protein